MFKRLPVPSLTVLAAGAAYPQKGLQVSGLLCTE